MLQKSAGVRQPMLVIADSATVVTRTWDSNHSDPVRLLVGWGGRGREGKSEIVKKSYEQIDIQVHYVKLV